MKRLALIATLLFCATAFSQTTKQADVRTFELTAIAPAKPALKHQLLFDDLGDRRPGNAALLYMDAILLMGPDAKEKTEKALDAYTAKDFKTFDSLADSLDLATVFDELDLAGRREECNWQPPFRERGAMTYLPHLEPLAHAMTRLVKIKALRQAERGKAEDALNTLRLGYEMSNNVGQEGILISGLVAVHITTEMSDALANLMSRPESPNLYWALSEFPTRRGILRKSMDGERMWWTTSYPNLVKSTSGQDMIMLAKNGNLSADQWRSMLNFVWDLQRADGNSKVEVKHPDPVNDAGANTIKQAQQHYMQTHNVSAEEVAKVDPIIIVGEFYFFQYEVSFDDTYKLRGMPYPILLSKAEQAFAESKRLSKQQPANPFLPIFDCSKAAMVFARADRQLAALTAVEAIRSYAAASGGALPEVLDAMVDTPVPQNPLTGGQFEYRVTGDTATLSDSQPDYPLTYTIKIRK